MVADTGPDLDHRAAGERQPERSEMFLTARVVPEVVQAVELV